jgi:hypothetical protein
MKVYIALLKEYNDEGEIDSVSIAYVTSRKGMSEDIEYLWSMVRESRYKNDALGSKALQALHDKYGINTWSGADLQVHEEEVRT